MEMQNPLTKQVILLMNGIQYLIILLQENLDTSDPWDLTDVASSSLSSGNIRYGVPFTDEERNLIDIAIQLSEKREQKHRPVQFTRLGSPEQHVNRAKPDENPPPCPRCNSTKTKSFCRVNCGFCSSPSHYYLSGSSPQDQFPFVGGAFSPRVVCIDNGCSPNDVNGDGTTTIDPILQPHQLTDQGVKVGETVLGTSPWAGYSSSSSQGQFSFDGGESSTPEVCIDIGSGPNDVNGDGTAPIDPILQAAQLSTDQWVKLAEIVLGISAVAGYTSSSNFPKAANAAGFIASLTAISLRHTGRAATRILAKFGAIACAAGTLAAMGKDLPEEYKWVGTVAFLIPAIAVAFA